MGAKKFYYGVITLYVILVYAFYPAFHLTVNATPQALYQYLTQSLLAGHLDIGILPSIELLQLPDPYDPLQNRPFRMHDASLFQGKYYLYFGLLPVIFFHLPFSLLTGLYASEGLVVFSFLSLAFMVGFKLLFKIKEDYFPTLPQWQLGLAGLLLSFANGVTVLFSVPRVYESAIASAFCFMMIAFYFLYRFIHDYRTRDLGLFSLSLALTVAGRPHFALVVVILISLIFVYLNYQTTNDKTRMLVALLIPPLFVAVILGSYNYLRFGSVLDFGHIWQLSCNNIKDLYSELSQISKIPRNFCYSFYFYFLQPITLSLKFPYFGLRMHHCTHFIDKDYFFEAVGGVFLTTPLIVLVLALPKMLMSYFKEQKTKRPLVWFLAFLLLVSIVNVLILLSLPFAIQRYNVDFLPYLVFLAIVCFWMIEDSYKASRLILLLRVFFVGSSVMAIILGLCFALIYWVFKN
ncbi:MAG: hypothetical protein H0U70_08470 [Tatlockia sp.]|nr:hypothetical protein [Tatlockia sp.]